MRCSGSRSSVIHAILKEFVVGEVVDGLSRVSDSHKLSRELIRLRYTDDVVRKMLRFKSVGIKPNVHIVDTCASLWELQALEHISRSGVDVATDSNLIKFLIAFLGHLDLEGLVQVTADVHSAKRIGLAFDERLVPSEVTWRKVHGCKVHDEHLTTLCLVRRFRSYSDNPHSVHSRSENLLHIKGKGLSAHHELVYHKRRECSCASLVHIHRHIVVFHDVHPGYIRDALLLRGEGDCDLSLFLLRCEVEVLGRHLALHLHLIHRSGEVHDDLVNDEVRVSGRLPFALVLFTCKVVHSIRGRVKVGGSMLAAYLSKPEIDI